MTTKNQSARAGDGKALTLPYSMDLDQAGIRERVAVTISGAIALGAQNESVPPEGHWLAEFWRMGRTADEWRSTVWAVARALNCLPSTYSDDVPTCLEAIRCLETLRAALAAAPAVSAPAEWRKAVQEAYGWLWHINNEPLAPAPLLPEGKAAYQARKALRELLTSAERGDAINAVTAAIDNMAGIQAPGAAPGGVNG